VAAIVRSALEIRTPALVSELDRDVRVLLSLPLSSVTEPLVQRLASRIARRHDVSVAVGRASTPDRTLREARQVADAVPAGSDRLVHRLEDVHLRGLLRLLGDDDRLRLYTDRELEPLRRHDADHGSDLLAALRALVDHPSSKSDAARSLHLSRAAFYDRLARVEQVLGMDLDDPDVRVSLHVALLADELSANPG
jgi:purine catabolism regulator